MAKPVLFGELNTYSMQALVDGGMRTAILPVGATEQHGPALPLNLDYVCAESIAHGVSEQTGIPVFPALPYGHSGGHVDDKTEFVHKLTSGGSDFVTIELTEQSISVSKNIAVVRHKLNAQTNDNNKPGVVHLAVLLIWQKRHGNWKLLARQAVKIQ